MKDRLGFTVLASCAPVASPCAPVAHIRNIVRSFAGGFGEGGYCFDSSLAHFPNCWVTATTPRPVKLGMIT